MADSVETTIHRYTEAIYGLEQGRVRGFVIVGSERALLLDAGVQAVDLRPHIQSITSRPLTVALTHADGDHTAALEPFHQVYAHPEEIPLLERRLPAGSHQWLPAPEGHLFDLGSVRLRVLHTPGHTPGSICLLDEAAGALFSGDTLSHGPVFLFGPERSLPTYIATLDRLEVVAGYEEIYCCHGSCPVDRGVIGELRACAQGIQAGTLEGATPADRAFPNPQVKIYSVGQSGILWAPAG